MALPLGAYTQLLIRRTEAGRAVTVKVLEATARRLGWLDAFPVCWEAAAAEPEAPKFRRFGMNTWCPSYGGITSGAWITSKTYRKGAHPRLRFRITGPWTLADLETLRLATVPELHALTAGRLRWCRLQA